MPRNGSGTYSLPAGNPVVANTVISPVWANNTLTDLATAMTGSLARNGEGAATGNIPMGGFKLTNVGLATTPTDYARADQVQTYSLQTVTSPAAPTDNTYTGNLVLGATTFTLGQQIIFSFPETNTGDATLNINNSNDEDILRADGTPLQVGDLRDDIPSLLMWGGTGWLLLNLVAFPIFATGTPTFNTGVGVLAFQSNTTGIANTAFGASVLQFNTTGDGNSAFGAGALQLNTTGFANTAVGKSALASNTTANGNTGVGYNVLQLSTGNSNTGVGYGVLGVNTTGGSNSAFGVASLGLNTTGANNSAFGDGTLGANTTGNNNTAVGVSALTLATGSNNTALGASAFSSVGFSFTNCTGLGANTTVTGSNQVQLGDSATTTYAYGAVQNRSDQRDKADIRNTALGLDFILSLRPVDFKWDYREDYVDGDAPGARVRNRYHHGFIAQEVAALGEFGGYQDHKVRGGEDVLSLGYQEFIAPMVRAVQELTARVAELERRN